MVPALDTFYTTDEVAGKLRVSRNTVIMLIDQGKLKATRVGRLYRIAEPDLLDYIRRNTNIRDEDLKGH